MKRFALLFAMLMMVILPMSALASGTPVWDGNLDDDTVVIKGTASPGELVTIIILNNGYSYDDYVSSSATNAERNAMLKYIGYTIAGADGSFSSPSIKFVTGGTFNVFASGGKIENHKFYTATDKRNAILTLRSERTTSSAEELLEVFALNTNILYTEYPQSLGNLAARADMLNGSPSANLNDEQEKILDILLIAPFDNGKEELIFGSDGYSLRHAEEIGVTSAGVKIPEYESFLSDGTPDDGAFSLLNATGKANVKNALLNTTYNSSEDILETFKDAYYYNVIMNNKYEGVGHIQKLFTAPHFGTAYANLPEFTTVFSAAGKTFPPTKNVTLYENLLKSGASNLTDIAKELVKTTASAGNNNPEALRPPQSFTPSSPSGSTGGAGTGTTTTTPSAPTGKFSDTNSHWASEAIEALAKEGIINGYTDNSFKPENSVTRAEFAKMLAALLKLDITSKDAGFADVNSADWYAPYIAAAAKAGLIMGNDGNFNPNEVISRQDTAVILARALGLKANGESSFADGFEIADYAKDAAAAVQEADLMKGMEDGSFEPLGSLTRAQAATVLYRLLERGV